MNTRQTSEPLDQLNLNITGRAAIGLVREMQDGGMTLDAPYQRGSVWTEAQRIELVRSWMTGTPIPAVIINNRLTPEWKQASRAGNEIPVGEADSAVIDGKQRLQAAAAWFGGKLLVPASWFRDGEVQQTERSGDGPGPYVRYTGLSRAGRLHCDRTWALPVGTAKVATIGEEAAIYLRVNGSGTVQTDADMTRAAKVAGR